MQIPEEEKIKETIEYLAHNWEQGKIPASVVDFAQDVYARFADVYNRMPTEAPKEQETTRLEEAERLLAQVLYLYEMTGHMNRLSSFHAVEKLMREIHLFLEQQTT